MSDMSETPRMEAGAAHGAAATVAEAPVSTEHPQAGLPTLRLHRMEITGFKSFSRRTEIEFPDGITAVVGPNGCGKSNIGDALNWVLGEQSARMLRGVSMQDVIFSGTDARKPLGMAEVSLHLVAKQGSLPDGRQEVVVTRRLFRAGESEYRLNGARARLKDIQEMLRNAHVGAKTYATIEQGRVDQILNAKPKERRLIIEDAAGVSGFKHKRRLAELKMDATHANLLRINDILAEVRRQINSLKRQAAKARRYQRLREEWRTKERIRFGSRARTADEDLAGLRREEGRIGEAEAAAAASLAKMDAEVASGRQTLEEADRVSRETSRRFHQLEAQVEREEERIQLCRERIQEAEETSGRLDKEAESLDTRKADLEREVLSHREQAEAESLEVESLATKLAAKQKELDEATRRMEELRKRVEELGRGLFESMNQAAEQRNRRRALEESLQRIIQHQARAKQESKTVRESLGEHDETLKSLVREAEVGRKDVASLEEGHEADEKALGEARGKQATEVEALAAAREEEKSSAARLRTLEDIETRFAGVSDGVRILLSSGSSAGVNPVGVVADFLEAGRQLEGAAEVYLQDLLPTVVLEDDPAATRAASLLRSGKAGRTRLLSRTQPAGGPAVGTRNGRPAFPEKLLKDSRVLGRLHDHLKLKAGANGFLEDRLGEALIVDTLESALALHRTHPEVDYLTPDGDVVYASGVVAVGGQGTSDKGLLSHKRKTQEARDQISEASTRARVLLERVESGRTRTTSIEERLGTGRSKLEDARHRLVKLEMQIRQSSDEKERTQRQEKILTQELSGLENEAGQISQELGRASRDVEDAERAHGEAEERLGREAAELKRVEKAPAEIGEEVAVLREQLAAHRQRQETADRQHQQMREAIAEIEARLEAARRGSEESTRRGGEAADLMSRTEADLAGHLEQREGQAEVVSERDHSIAEHRGDLADREERLRGLRSDLESKRQASSAAEVARARAEAQRQHLDDLCVQELGMTATEAAQAASGSLEHVDLEALDAEVAQIKEGIEKIGPVNMMAIEEFSELEDRHAFLSSQKKDLEDSMESLKETIRRINRSSRERFTKAFEIIRANYREIFKVLFSGGRADLRLEEEGDVLECGIEILAQPPGKRLGNIQLLSGGEKAMSAIALLFAIFRHQPSPFCMLDEVDAALDDVNVGRFTRMLQEYAKDTQFVLVTHNKLSMEIADLLYGVTMEEPGVSRLVSLQLE